ncbi:MAG: ABC transporter permease, partial [Acetobacteraceae bacterium]|nr:ABC transporter permease [Acetobacteraceae bacterium]
MGVLQAAPPGWLLERGMQESELRLSGDWIASETGLRDDATIRRVLAEADGAARLRFDASSVGRWDSALVVFVEELRDAAARLEPKISLDLSGLPEPVQRLLTVARSANEPQAAPAKSPRAPLLVRVGQAASGAWLEAVEIAALVGETALRGGPVLLGRTRTRAADVVELMRQAGAGALGIVAIVNGLVGAIL